jgi:hypothetical protein
LTRDPVKLRINRDLHERLRNCAEAVDRPLGEYVGVLVRLWRKGQFSQEPVRVATVVAMEFATREDSVVITAEDCDCDPASMRRAIVMGVLYAEARNPKPFETALVAGKDYVVGEGW